MDLLSLALVLAGDAAWAGSSECTPADAEVFCSLGGSETNLITQGVVDEAGPELTTNAWVITGTNTVSLPSGAYAPGDAIATNQPSIWVRDQATLEID
ncbi:MAG: hypothetical protein AAF602_29655, partial [Myxococcota bacterium]